MNVILPREQLEKYEKIFTFMLSLKHVSYLLADGWHSLKFSQQSHPDANRESTQLRQIHLIRFVHR